MAKKEEVVELKTKAEKISEAHLNQIRGAVNSVNKLYFNIGQIESQKLTLLNNVELAKKHISELQGMLEKEYGSFDVNLDDGTINWPKEDSNEK
tara:strand:- start:194 stop:475 length:282 start_codon:yes stop_codon:yes gene_type:complete